MRKKRLKSNQVKARYVTKEFLKEPILQKLKDKSN